MAISQTALLKICHWEPWENLDLAREPPFKKVWAPLAYSIASEFDIFHKLEFDMFMFIT